MANREYLDINLATVCLDTPYTRDVMVSVGASATVSAGTLLALKSPGIYSPAVDGVDTAVAVMQYDLTNDTAGALDLPARPVLGGKVNANLLSFDGGGTPDENEYESLRGVGIEAVHVEELTKLNNPG